MKKKPIEKRFSEKITYLKSTKGMTQIPEGFRNAKRLENLKQYEN